MERRPSRAEERDADHHACLALKGHYVFDPERAAGVQGRAQG
jgi:hypothetical protein